MNSRNLKDIHFIATKYSDAMFQINLSWFPRTYPILMRLVISPNSGKLVKMGHVRLPNTIGQQKSCNTSRTAKEKVERRVNQFDPIRFLRAPSTRGTR